MKPIEGNAYAYNEEATLPGVAFRAVNEAYSESTGTVNQATESLVILGGDADVDRFSPDPRQPERSARHPDRMKVKAASYKFQDTFFNGDVAVDTKCFDGLKKRLTGAQVIAAATNGLAVVGADDTARHSFLDQLDALIALAGLTGDNGALYVNDLVKAKLLSSGRRLAATTDRETLAPSTSHRPLQRHPAPRPRREPRRNPDPAADRDPGLLERHVLDLRRAGSVRTRATRPSPACQRHQRRRRVRRA